MLSELLKKTRSYRSFDPEVEVSEELLLEFIDNARISSATMNLQPLKYRLVTSPDEMAKLLPLTRWASVLGIKLPPDGHEPKAAIIVCHDTEVTPFNPIFLKDVGICSEIIMLSAAERGFGGCIIGSADAQKLSDTFGLSQNLLPQLVLTFGKPDEAVVIEDAEGGDIKYYRDAQNLHHAPKRKLSDIVIK